jgi:hypothetical protein
MFEITFYCWKKKDVAKEQWVISEQGRETRKG